MLLMNQADLLLQILFHTFSIYIYRTQQGNVSGPEILCPG